ncbi:MAG: helix-turn-helix transcriptional regulator [Dehalococcoidales bacterium]|nr:helix-turn-helix transcriptional regulator [Dehalococcoidales bacterium]
MNFPEIVKNIRNNLNISQEQLARDLNVSFSTINRWENGHTGPSKLAKLRFIEYCRDNAILKGEISQLLDLQTSNSKNHLRGK